MVQALSDREFILQRVVHLLTESRDDNNASNLVLQLALTELVKQMMREMVQDTEGTHLRGNLLRKAIQITSQLIVERAETADLSFILAPYFERISRSLRPVAHEMVGLGVRLQAARQGELLPFPHIVTDASVPFRITELGMLGNLDGLTAQPLTTCNLNLDGIRQEYRIQGMGFPYEVEIDEITFIVEADASIITFLAGFPASVIEQARLDLELLAHALYTPVTFR